MVRNLVLHISQIDGIAVIALEGFLDAHTAPQFEEAIQSEIDAGRRNIVVDCARLLYISSAGLGVFMGFIGELRETGGDIKICGVAAPRVLQLFEVSGFKDLFGLAADLPAAVALFREKDK